MTPDAGGAAATPTRTIAGTAAITGAAGGLGAAFARQLAADGYDLLLTDRDADGLERIAVQLRPGVNVDAVVADLTVAADVDRLARQLAEIGELMILVNNAGFGTYSLFHESDIEREAAMVEVHVLATMRLCRAVLPAMVARGRGRLINVASVGAFMRFPRDATYIGTKSFLVAFTECLATELPGTGVAVQALCPGWMVTGFDPPGYRSPIPRWLYTAPETVVASSLASRSVVHIPTIRTRLAAAALGSRLGRRALATARAARSDPRGTSRTLPPA